MTSMKATIFSRIIWRPQWEPPISLPRSLRRSRGSQSRSKRRSSTNSTNRSSRSICHPRPDRPPPCKSKKFSSRRKVRWYEEVKTTNDDLTPIDAKVASGEAPPTSNQIKLVPTNSSVTKGAMTLSKRARQRRRQRLAKEFAKAIESTDGIRYNADLKNRRGKQPQRPMNGDSKPPTNE